MVSLGVIGQRALSSSETLRATYQVAQLAIRNGVPGDFVEYGVLFREALDGMYGRCRPDQWQRYILGVEGWDDYRNPSWGCYSEVRIQDFAEMDISGFDLVTMIDSFEHLDRKRGQSFLDGLLAKNRHVLISVPVGVSEQGAVHGNEFERHRTQFNGDQFNRYSPAVLHQSYCRVYSIAGQLQ